MHLQSKVWILLLPCICMAFDIMTGLLHAWVSETFQSARIRAGLAKKVGEPISQNEKRNFYVVDDALRQHVKAIRKYIRDKRLNG